MNGKAFSTCLAAGFLLVVGCSRSPKEEPALPVPAASAAPALPTPPALGPLKVAYSDWPGWVAWQVAIEKKYFEEAGVDVSFVWLEYIPTIEAFSEGNVDAVCMTNGDALVAGSSGAPSVGILINDYSNGNDMVVARAGIDSVAGLRGKRIGVEVGFVDHLLLMEALKSASLTEMDVSIVNTKTHETTELLSSGGVDAVAAWQPHSGHALERVPGAKAVFTSANAPGLIYDLLFVSRASLAKRRQEWLKVLQVWFRVVDFISDPVHHAEALQIMAKRVALTPDKYEKLMGGTRLMAAAENQRRFRAVQGFESVQGSSEIVDRFNVGNHVYKTSVAVESYFDGSLVDEVIAAH